MSTGRIVQPPAIPSTGLSIGEASELLDVPAPTIRSWERRYGIPAPPRSAGGHRRFSDEDMQLLRLMRDEVAKGQRAVDASAWVKARADSRHPYQDTIEAMVEAARALDHRAVLTVLDEAAVRHGTTHAVCDVLLPAMRQIGLWWQTGRCDVAQEHLASEAALAWMHSRPSQRDVPHRGTVLLACGPRDHHTIGLEALALLLRERGADARALGSRVPADALVAAIRATDASAVVLVSHLAVGRRQALESLTAAGTAGPAVYYAGNAFGTPAGRRRVPGTYLGTDFAAAADTVADRLGEVAGA
jgi:MerR family transcriptional regulator, light-induced transcriptional regulator